MGLSFSFNWGKQPLSVEIDQNGNYFYEMYNSKSSQNKFTSNAQKVNSVLTNIALLKVFSVNCDLFSSGKVIQGKDNYDFLKKQMPHPNPKQNWTQYFWDYMFWIQTGTALQYNDRVTSTTQWLNPAKISFDSSLIDKMKGLILRNVTYKDIIQGSLKYDLGNGNSQLIPLKDIKPYFDLSSGMKDNFFEGASRLDSLSKVISNIEQALDAKGINLEFSQNFMVSGMKSGGVIGQDSLPMGEAEKLSIESSIRSSKKVIATKTPVDIKRFVDDIYKLRLDDSVKADFSLVGSVYGMPKEIIDIIAEGSTYENQSKAIGRHVDYFHKAKANDLIEGLMSVFGWTDLKYSFDHLSFNQVFEVERQNRIKLQLENEKLAKELNVNIQDYGN